MRKTQKQDILEIIKTLNEANEEVKNNIKAGSYAYAQDMLAQCQECAISIGNAIESAEGEGAATISYIEEYCDIVYQIHGELNGGGDANANKIYKNIRKQLLRIENSVRNDIPVRKEIAFFPYKASMWDSLESIYLAAKKDPGCDAYCVPIPYYDVNADGSLGQMHYEGREYPKNIEVTDWEKYDLENRKPDVAYIHNPYDEYNLVTRVHSKFYSSNIKKYVDELVYVPYFVLAEIEPDDQNAIDGMKHFIWLPGVVNADKVIVQSEKMAQIYRNEFRKAAIANGLPEQFISKAALEKKILGLGSPKIEKVKNTKKEDLEIPREWQKIINRPDGSRKKIVFYNTSIGALLANNGKMLEKMKDVFRIFKEHRDDIALLWRPHPLIENTVKSMRPQLWGEYKKIVEQYKAEGWGIYDDTSDMDRAVVLSDAYYGDGSSVVQLYRQTGKPVMMQSCAMAEQGSTDWFEAMCIDGDTVWIAMAETGALCECSYPEFEIRKVIQYPEEIRGIQRPFYRIKKQGDYLVLTPFLAGIIMLYDCKTEKIRLMDMDRKKLGISEDSKSFWVEAYRVNELLHLCNGLTDKYMVLDVEAMSLTYKDNLYVEVGSRLCSQNQTELDSRAFCGSDEDYVFLSVYNNHVTRWNYKTGKSSVVSIGKEGERFVCLFIDSDKYWMLQLDVECDTVVCYDLASQITEYYPVRGTERENRYRSYAVAEKIGNEIYFFQNKRNSVSINVDTKETKKVIFGEIGTEECEFCCCVEHGGYIYLYEKLSGTIVEIDKGDIQNRKLINIQFNDEYKNCKYASLLSISEKGNTTGESSGWKLTDLIGALDYSDKGKL